MDDDEAAAFLELMAEKLADDLAFEDALMEAAQALRENARATTAILQAISHGRIVPAGFEIPDTVWRRLCEALGVTPRG